MEQSTSDFPYQSQIHSLHTMRIIYEYKKVQTSGVGNFLAQEITLPFGCWVKMWTVLVMGTTIVITVIIGLSLGIKGKEINNDAPSPVVSSVCNTVIINCTKSLQELSIDIYGLQDLSNISSPQYRSLLLIMVDDSLQVYPQYSERDFITAIQRYALTILYFSTGGPYWLSDMSLLNGED